MSRPRSRSACCARGGWSTAAACARGSSRTDDWLRVTGGMDRSARAALHRRLRRAMTVMEIRAKARRLAARQPGGWRLVVVDYLQLMQAPASARTSRVQEISQISRALKVLARDLGVPGDARSRSSRARSRAPGQAPDALRPARVRLDRAGRGRRHVHLPRRLLQRRGSAPRRKGLAEVHVAKHRNGPTGTINLRSASATRSSRDFAPRGGVRSGTVVVGAQWGDEGKGKIVDLLAESFADRGPLPGRQQRRAHRARRRDVHLPAAAERHPRARQALRARQRRRDRPRGAVRGARGAGARGRSATGCGSRATRTS